MGSPGEETQGNAQSDASVAALVDAAREARAMAHAPYSGFGVGAALLASSGEIVRGCNVENASYGLTICAERNALFAAIAGGLRSFDAIAVYTETDAPTTPCGACRQVLAEFAPHLAIYLACAAKGVDKTSIEELLPRAFRFRG